MGRRDGRRRFEGTAEIIGPVPKRAAKVGCDRVRVDSHAGVGVEPCDGYVAQFSRALHGFRMSRRNLLSSYQIAKPTASIRPEATMSTKRIGRKSSGVIVIHLSVPNGN